MIESKTYENFADFKRDVLATFKPKRTVTEIESIISRLTQNDKESVGEYAKRVFVLKVEYEQASQAERAAVNAQLDEVRINEMEKKVSNSFISGLKDHVLRFANGKPAMLSDAVSVALEAESISSIRYQNRKLIESSGRKTDDSKKFKDKDSGRAVSNKREFSQRRNEYKSEVKTRSDETRKCYECGSLEHIEPNCPKLATNETPAKARALSQKTRKTLRHLESQIQVQRRTKNTERVALWGALDELLKTDVTPALFNTTNNSTRRCTTR